MKSVEFVPLGRLVELQGRPDAHLLAYTVQGHDARVVRYKSREALKFFCKEGSRHHAVVKDVVTTPSMLWNKNMQRLVTPVTDTRKQEG